MEGMKIIYLHLPNSTVNQFEQNYRTIVLVIWLICKCFKKDSCLLFMNWGKWESLMSVCRDLKFKQPEQESEQQIIY